MPKEVKNIKQFIELARGPDASSARIKKVKKGNVTKFKIRYPKILYTLRLDDPEKADKLRQSLPPNMHIDEIGKKNKRSKSSS